MISLTFCLLAKHLHMGIFFYSVYIYKCIEISTVFKKERGGNILQRPSTTSTWCHITCSSHIGLWKNVSIWLGLSFYTCWGPTSLPMVLAYIYSTLNTLNQGTLWQLVGPWKLLEVSSLFIFLHYYL